MCYKKFVLLIIFSLFNKMFSHGTASLVIEHLHINLAALTGEERKRTSTVYIKTMDSIAEPLDYFWKALNTELEHGNISLISNVTDNHAVSTGQIVLAHLLGVEIDDPNTIAFPAYYDFLWEMEKNKKEQPLSIIKL